MDVDFERDLDEPEQAVSLRAKVLASIAAFILIAGPIWFLLFFGRQLTRDEHDDADASLDDQREAVGTLEEIEPIARRVLGGAHPVTEGIEGDLRKAQAGLRARETPLPGSA